MKLTTTLELQFWLLRIRNQEGPYWNKLCGVDCTTICSTHTILSMDSMLRKICNSLGNREGFFFFSLTKIRNLIDLKSEFIFGVWQHILSSGIIWHTFLNMEAHGIWKPSTPTVLNALYFLIWPLVLELILISLPLYLSTWSHLKYQSQNGLRKSVSKNTFTEVAIYPWSLLFRTRIWKIQLKTQASCRHTHYLSKRPFLLPPLRDFSW